MTGREVAVLRLVGTRDRDPGLSGRREFQKRRVLACKSTAEAIGVLRERDQKRVFTHTALGERANVVFMFPGGGAQYVNMARGLYDAEPAFKRNVDRGLEYLRTKVARSNARARRLVKMRVTAATTTAAPTVTLTIERASI